MYLCDDFNMLIEATKSLLFLRKTTYPPAPDPANGEKNVLQCELRNPDSKGFYRVSVTAQGPWRTVLCDPDTLLHVFRASNATKLTKMQKLTGGTLVTLFTSHVTPEPTTFYCHPQFDFRQKRWIIQAQKDCKTYDGVPTADIRELVFKTPCQDNMILKLVEDYKNFLVRTVFMFYDIAVEFKYEDQIIYKRDSIDVPVPWSTTKRLKQFLTHCLGRPASVGSAWFAQNDLEDDDDDFQTLVDMSFVSFGLAEPSDCLPVWLLGPSGLPVLDFNKTQFVQLVCEAAGAPPDLLQQPYQAPGGLPDPDFCLQLPPQHALTKRSHLLVIVGGLPIQHRTFTKSWNLTKVFDAVMAHQWEPSISTMRETLINPSQTEGESDNDSICRGIAAAISKIIRISLNTTFTKECHELLKVKASVEGEDDMENTLLSYLEENLRNKNMMEEMSLALTNVCTDDMLLERAPDQSPKDDYECLENLYDIDVDVPPMVKKRFIRPAGAPQQVSVPHAKKRRLTLPDLKRERITDPSYETSIMEYSEAQEFPTLQQQHIGEEQESLPPLHQQQISELQNPMVSSTVDLTDTPKLPLDDIIEAALQESQESQDKIIDDFLNEIDDS